MTGFKYLSDAETLLSSKRPKRNRPNTTHDTKIQETPTAMSSDVDHMNRILDSYRDLEEDEAGTAKLRGHSRQSSKTPSARLQLGSMDQTKSVASIVTQKVVRAPELTVLSTPHQLDSREQSPNASLATGKTTPKLTLPSRQQHLARRASRRRARDAILPQESIKRLSAIMEAELPKSSERTVTMALSEIPPGLLSPTALNIAKEVPERLINFKVSFHPVLDVIGMSAEQAIHNGIALPVDALITPRTIAASDSLKQRQQQVNEKTPTNIHRWQIFGRKPSDLRQDSEPTPKTPLDVPQKESRRLPKTVHFSNQEDVFDITPSISDTSVKSFGKESFFNATEVGRSDMRPARIDRMGTVQREHSFGKQKGTNEDNGLMPILPELDFDRASDNFESMFDKYQADLRTLVADMPGLPGVSQRACSPNKGRRDDPRSEPDNDSLSVEINDILEHPSANKKTENEKDRKTGLQRPDSFTLGIDEQDVTMRPAHSILEHNSPQIVSSRLFLPDRRQKSSTRQFPALPGPPPSIPLPSLPSHVVTTKARSGSKVNAPQFPQQQRQQGSREWNYSQFSLPAHSRFPRIKPSENTPRAATISSSSCLTGRSKIHATQLANLPQVLSASLSANFSDLEVENSFLSHSPYPSIPALLRLHSTAVTPYRPPVFESTYQRTYSPSSPKPLLEYSSDSDTVRPIPDWSSSDSDTSEKNKRIPATSVDEVTSLELAPLKLGGESPESHTPESALFSTGSNETPSDLSKSSELENVNRQLNDLLTSEIDRLYHELPTNNKAIAHSPIVRVGDTRRRPLLVEAQATGDFSRDLNKRSLLSPPRNDKMGGCFSKPAEEQETRPSSSSNTEDPCRSPSIISTGLGPMPFQELIAEFMPAKPIDIPPGDAAQQARFRYTGDAIDICNLPNTNRAYSDSIAHSSGTEYFGVSNMSLSTRAGASQADINDAEDLGVIGCRATRNNDPSSNGSKSDNATIVLDKGKAVAPTENMAVSRDKSPKSSINHLLARYSVSDLRAAFPLRSDASLRAEYGKQPGTPEPPYYGKEYANHRKISTCKTSSLDDTATFVEVQQPQDDPFTGVPDRSNLMFSASGKIPQGLVEAHVREFANTDNDGDDQIEGVVAASTPLTTRSRLDTIPPALTRRSPLPLTISYEFEQNKTKKASELIRELNLLASNDPEVSNLLRLSGFRGNRAPSVGSGTSSGATAAASAPFLTSETHSSNPDIQGELLHQRDERARIERQERARQRLEKKISKATLKSQKSLGDRSGLFGRFRRSSGSSGPTA